MLFNMNSHSSQRIIAGKRAFCVALKKGNVTSRTEGNLASDFKPIIKESQVAWVNFVVDDVFSDGETIAEFLGFSSEMVTTLLASKNSGYEDRDNELGIMLPAVSTTSLDVTIHPLIILIRKGLILSFHDKAISRLLNFSRYAEVFMKKLGAKSSWEDKMTLLLWRIMDENNSKNFDHLREIEEQADGLVKELMDPATPREQLGGKIYMMKHALIVYLDSLWATLDVVNTLRYGDAETLTDDPQLLNRISSLANELTTQISLTEHMSEVLASGLEVLQSIYNNQLQILNNRLALVVTWLTVLGTAVLVPNTLATLMGISAISEHLDEFSILSILTVSTVLAIVFSYWFIKTKCPLTAHVCDTKA